MGELRKFAEWIGQITSQIKSTLWLAWFAGANIWESGESDELKCLIRSLLGWTLNKFEGAAAKGKKRWSPDPPPLLFFAMQ